MTDEHNTHAQRCLDTTVLTDPAVLPSPWPRPLLERIQAMIPASGHKIVVLDDDPTGTQTVHGIPVYTRWSVEDLVEALAEPGPAFYLLTNSRSLTEPAACALAREIGLNLEQAARQSGTTFDVISRSDSTLRGHFPAEVDALAAVLERGHLPCLLIPCFFEGGRYTIDNVHYVAEGETLIPAADTVYARDTAFGYRHSDLRRWVAEKTGDRIPTEKVAAVSLEDIRSGGPKRVTEILSSLENDTACIVNAVSYRDLEVVTLGLLAAEARGHHFLFRTAASYVRVRCGLPPRDLLQASDLTENNRNGGMFVVGSYVTKTTDQVAALIEQTDIASIEIAVDRLLDANQRTDEIQRAADAINGFIGSGRDAVLLTSRRLVTGDDAAASLAIGVQVSAGLIAIIRKLAHKPRYLVAKGGITSSDVATRGLNIRRAMILGQVLPGVPVWELGGESRYPGMAYIVFPGNVGETGALAEIKNRLKASATGGPPCY